MGSEADQGLLDPEEQAEYTDVTYTQLVRQFMLMGWTAFGGPSAHIALFETVRPISPCAQHTLGQLLLQDHLSPKSARQCFAHIITASILLAHSHSYSKRAQYCACVQTFVQQARWMSEMVFLELFALSSCLPGPTSTQVSFALGAVKRGISGGLLGGVLFQYPGLIMMSIAGVGAAKYLNTSRWWARAAVDGEQSSLAWLVARTQSFVCRRAAAVCDACILMLSINAETMRPTTFDNACVTSAVSRKQLLSLLPARPQHVAATSCFLDMLCVTCQPDRIQVTAYCAGLAAAAVALVAVAAKSLIAKTAKDQLTTFILLASAALSFVFSTRWLFPVLLTGGGLMTLLANTLKKTDMAMTVCLH